jgi:hypothetical protein
MFREGANRANRSIRPHAAASRSMRSLNIMYKRISFARTRTDSLFSSSRVFWALLHTKRALPSAPFQPANPLGGETLRVPSGAEPIRFLSPFPMLFSAYGRRIAPHAQLGSEEY